jgi:signal transduction histidine kinase
MVTRRTDPELRSDADRHLDDVPVPILVVDVSDDRILDANESAAALVPCSPQDLVVLPLHRALVGDDARAELKVGDRVVPVKILGRPGWRDSEGPSTLVLLDRLELAMAAMDEGELRDETAHLRRQLEEFRRGQERLVSVWAHELKTPLTVIQSYLEILTTDLDEGLSDEQLSFLKITKDSVLRLRRLVLDLVDLIGFRSGHLSVDTVTVDVAGLLDEVITEMRPLARDAALELVHERPAVRVAIRADADRVSQILRNLIDNAFKFTLPGGRITVRTRVERDWVIIDVVDNGVGIHPADMDRIFEEFVQLKRDVGRRRQQGSGLGLAISQRIAQAHGGAIEVVSELNKGSVFSVRLPREHDEIE